MYFDGSDVGLTAYGEDVDAAAVDAAGKIYLSTSNNFAVTGVSGADEDVFVFTPTTLARHEGTFRRPLLRRVRVRARRERRLLDRSSSRRVAARRPLCAFDGCRK